MTNPANRQKLKRDIATLGPTPSPQQSVKIAAKRKELLQLLETHRATAMSFCPWRSEYQEQEGESKDDQQPELLSTLLPGRLPTVILRRYLDSPIIETERQLRRVSCLKALQTVRSLVAQKAHLNKAKSARAKGTQAQTRAQVLIDSVTNRLDMSRWQYTASRQSLQHLGETEGDREAFRELKESDIRDMRALLLADRQPGQGFRVLPWYWRMDLSTEVALGATEKENMSQVEAEYQQSKAM